jgi:hypothetical protein
MLYLPHRLQRGLFACCAVCVSHFQFVVRILVRALRMLLRFSIIALRGVRWMELAL